MGDLTSSCVDCLAQSSGGDVVGGRQQVKSFKELSPRNMQPAGSSKYLASASFPPLARSLPGHCSMPLPRKSSESLKAAAGSLAALRQELFTEHRHLVLKLDAELARIQSLCSASGDSLGPTDFATLEARPPGSRESSRGSKEVKDVAATSPMQLPGMPEETEEQPPTSPKSPKSDANDIQASASLATFTTIAEARKKHMAWIRKVEEGKGVKRSSTTSEDEQNRVFSKLNPEYAAQSVRKAAISKFGPEPHTDSYVNCCTGIVQHSCFERVSLLVICLNAVWIAVDIEINHAETLLQAGAGTIVVEALFLVYFAAELFIRFWAQQRKKALLKDYWFLFDFGLVLLMLLETWLVPAIILMAGSSEAGGLGRAASVLRVVRLLRVLRTARIARIARYMPELMILIKGLIVAARSVFFTLVLLLLMTYVFSIALVTLSQGTDLELLLFPSMPQTVLRLLVQCTMPDSEAFFQSIAQENAVMAALFLIFILAGSLIVLNMLVGILVEAVQTVATMEHEQIHVDFAQRAPWLHWHN